MNASALVYEIDIDDGARHTFVNDAAVANAVRGQAGAAGGVNNAAVTLFEEVGRRAGPYAKLAEAEAKLLGGFSDVGGTIEDVHAIKTGQDLYTGEQLSGLDKKLHYLGLAPFVSGRVLRTGVDIIERGLEFARGIKVPSVRKGAFEEWFDDLDFEKFSEMWSDERIRKAIQRRLRSPGKYHEWLVVSRADVFKSWGISASEIRDYRTLISDIEGVDWVHGGMGSTTAHNEILEIIDSSENFEQFSRRLASWADYRVVGGRSSLPGGLQP